MPPVAGDQFLDEAVRERLVAADDQMPGDRHRRVVLRLLGGGTRAHDPVGRSTGAEPAGKPRVARHYRDGIDRGEFPPPVRTRQNDLPDSVVHDMDALKLCFSGRNAQAREERDDGWN
ncbi:hypothetical protein Val02_85000 [Virgisporangium aliadipatigenens]|uniref:Uncharacterized protein n=1 Tax=Virgisporangium aliadipatigenens TaxID=741659 RepID=A0A8J3YTZ6_9ACTN|nr:hypothetical protein Val02_85000 [Virgisporangium aliadipatigenens]